MARPLTPLEQKQLSAFIEIIPNRDVHLVQEALESGYYRGVSLYDAQRALSTHEGFREFSEEFASTSSYNRDVFSRFIDRIANDPRGLFDRIKRAVWNNDLDTLDPNKPAEPSARVGRGELIPPHPVADQPPAPPKPPDSSDKPPQEEAKKKPETPEEEEPLSQEPKLSEQTQQRLDEANRSVQRTQRARTQARQTGQQPAQPSERMQQRLSAANRRVRPSSEPSIPRERIRAGRTATINPNRQRNIQRRRLVVPGRPRPTPPSGGLLDALSNYWLARDALSMARWLADKLGFNRLGNLLGRLNNALGLPEQLLGNALRNFGSWAGGGLRTLIGNGLNYIGSGLGNFINWIGRNPMTIGIPPTVYATWGSITAAAVASLPAIIGIAIITAALFVATWFGGLFDKAANDGCANPGAVTIDKTHKAGEDVTVQVGENIEYEILVVYNIRCTRATASLEIKDVLPPNTTFVSASAAVGRLPADPTPSDEALALEQGVHDPSNNTVTWKINGVLPERPITISLVVTPTDAANNTWVMNEVTVTYSESRPLGTPGGGVIDVQSASLQTVIEQAAQRVGMEPALMKAFLRVEAQAALSYSEDEFRFFSTPGWWEGLVANASTREGNDPTIIRGYGYNTCAYVNCAPGADVRGVTQFEAGTWAGIAPKLQFSDGHTPDRRNATDAIFGSAILNRENAEYYAGTPDFQWTEDVIRAAGRIYCGGKSYARRKLLDGACMQGGKQYEDLLWQFYLEYSGK